MPWSNQSGGGGPWGGKGPGKPQSPWGSGPAGNGGRPPKDFETLFQRGQDRFNGMIPGGGLGGRTLALALLGVVLLWLASGAYTVRTNEIALNLIFGRYTSKAGEGLRYNFPYPVGSVIKVQVTDVNRIEVGFRSTEVTRRATLRDVNEESLMLTGDENIVDIDFAVQWQVDPAQPQNYVFNIQSPETTIKAVAESVMREVIGKRNIQAVLTTDRAAIEMEVLQLMQQALDSYAAGVRVRAVQLQRVDPPTQVIEAFRDVQAARQDQDRIKNEADTYASRVIPEARGQAARLTQDAEAYRERVVAEAQGATSRFVAIYDEYKKQPDLTRSRMFLETMERVLSKVDKVIIDPDSSGTGVVPYLPLTELQKRPAGARAGGTP